MPTRDLHGPRRFSLWLPFAQLPPNLQRGLGIQHAPRLVSVLRTKWPEARIAWEADVPPSV